MTRPRTAIVGLGVTGMSCVRFLHETDDLLALDTRDEPPNTGELARDYPDVEVLTGVREHPFAGVDRIVVSPGVALDNCLLSAARGRVPFVSDIDLFCAAATAPIIAVTGTNGKSTVTSLIGHLLSVAGLHSPAGGNLGEPALDMLDAAADAYVLELSSFQLERLAEHHFAAAGILNLSEDHLDRHGDMATYVRSKQRIFRDCELAVGSRDDPRTLPADGSPGELVTFGADEPAERDWGVRIRNGRRYLAWGEMVLLDTAELPIAGRHNEQNVLAACALLSGQDNPAELLMGVASFAGLPHRCQRVADIAGVSYINDSKATNVGATIAALDGFGASVAARLILIAGGDGKDADFSVLRKSVGKFVKTLVVFGRDAGLLQAALKDVTTVIEVADMPAAVSAASELAGPGDTVLLSPACASLDMYPNFAARGDDFAACVLGLAA